MTPDKNFRLKKATKALIALSGGTVNSRSEFKHAMIDAQLCEEAAKRAALKSKDTRENTPKGTTTARAHTAAVVTE